MSQRTQDFDMCDPCLINICESHNSRVTSFRVTIAITGTVEDMKWLLFERRKKIYDVIPHETFASHSTIIGKMDGLWISKLN